MCPDGSPAPLPLVADEHPTPARDECVGHAGACSCSRCRADERALDDADGWADRRWR